MKKIFLSYSAPEVEIYEVVAENGYGASSTMLPEFGVESDEFAY